MSRDLALRTRTTVRITRQKRKVITFSGKHAPVMYTICDLAEQYLRELEDANSRDEHDGRVWKLDRNSLASFLHQVNAGRGKKHPKKVLTII